jgi:hypothetical protein
VSAQGLGLRVRVRLQLPPPCLCMPNTSAWSEADECMQQVEFGGYAVFTRGYFGGTQHTAQGEHSKGLGPAGSRSKRPMMGC